MNRKATWMGIAAVLLIALLTTGYALFLRQPSFYGAAFDSPRQAAEIQAVDMHGNAFRLNDSRGKIVLLYFGYVHCPLECPLTMAHLKQALVSLGAEAQSVQVVMISTDPVRDTPESMRAFLAHFDPSFIGISGSPDALVKIYRDYHIVVLEGGETHSSFTYVIDRAGRLRLTFVPDSTAEDIAHDLRILLAEG
jgi:protein SCO1/2